MQTLSEIKALLAARGIRPKHRFGQNFLHDQNQLRRLIAHADVRVGDAVLEVGPGTGSLTAALLEAGACVVSCEIDHDMVEIMKDVFPVELASRTLRLVEGDCLADKRTLNPDIVAALSDTSAKCFSLIANLPYHAATPLIITLLISHRPGTNQGCRGMFMTIQREVAERITAPPSSKAYGPLSVLTQTLAVPEMLGFLPPSCFWPEPDVVSAMIAVHPKNEIAVPEADIANYAGFVRFAFAQRRKQLQRVVGPEIMARSGLDGRRRAETLAPEDFVRLFVIAKS